MNTYKEQFKEWNSLQPVVFHGKFNECENQKSLGAESINETLETHIITIKAIQKAMEL